MTSTNTTTIGVEDTIVNLDGRLVGAPALTFEGQTGRSTIRPEKLELTTRDGVLRSVSVHGVVVRRDGTLGGISRWATYETRGELAAAPAWLRDVVAQVVAEHLHVVRGAEGGVL